MFQLLLFFYFFRRVSFTKIKAAIDKLMIPATKFHRSRFWSLIGGLTFFEIFLMYLLWNIWYKQNKIGTFHFFDDSKEWLQMEKGGHIITSYSEARYSAALMRWSGLGRIKSALIGFVVGSWYQLTLEFLDGFADKWGFSVSDIAANTAGAGFFLMQEKVWKEQRVLVKVSNTPIKYPDLTVVSDNDNSVTTSVKARVENLYGLQGFAPLIKDYNAVNYWLSFNPKSFLKNDERLPLNNDKNDWQSAINKLPDWLNIAIGYSAENMYGGYENKWTITDAQGEHDFHLNEKDFPRYRQYFISLDVDWNRVKTHNLYHKTLATIFNSFKVPGPTLEFSEKGVRVHWIFW